MPLNSYLSLFKVGGHLIMVGAPEQLLPALPCSAFILGNVFLDGLAIGSPADNQEMLQLATKNHVRG